MLRMYIVYELKFRPMWYLGELGHEGFNRYHPTYPLLRVTVVGWSWNPHSSVSLVLPYNSVNGVYTNDLPDSVFQSPRHKKFDVNDPIRKPGKCKVLHLQSQTKCKTTGYYTPKQPMFQ